MGICKYCGITTMMNFTQCKECNAKNKEKDKIIFGNKVKMYSPEWKIKCNEWMNNFCDYIESFKSSIFEAYISGKNIIQQGGRAIGKSLYDIAYNIFNLIHVPDYNASIATKYKDRIRVWTVPMHKKVITLLYKCGNIDLSFRDELLLCINEKWMMYENKMISFVALELPDMVIETIEGSYYSLTIDEFSSEDDKRKETFDIKEVEKKTAQLISNTWRTPQVPFQFRALYNAWDHKLSYVKTIQNELHLDLDKIAKDYSQLRDLSLAQHLGDGYLCFEKDNTIYFVIGEKVLPDHRRKYQDSEIMKIKNINRWWVVYMGIAGSASDSDVLTYPYISNKMPPQYKINWEKDKLIKYVGALDGGKVDDTLFITFIIYEHYEKNIDKWKKYIQPDLIYHKIGDGITEITKEAASIVNEAIKSTIDYNVYCDPKIYSLTSRCTEIMNDLNKNNVQFLSARLDKHWLLIYNRVDFVNDLLQDDRITFDPDCPQTTLLWEQLKGCENIEKTYPDGETMMIRNEKKRSIKLEAPNCLEYALSVSYNYFSE